MINVKGGVTAPKGFKASGAACGLKKNGNKDIALVYSEETAVAVGVFTKNVVKGHSLQLTANNVKNGYANAVVINSGCANACLGEKGYRDAEDMAAYTAQLLNIDKENVLTGSTGVIGFPLDMNLIKNGIKELTQNMSENGGHDASEAIMTTDTFAKEVAVDIMVNGKNVRIGGMAKGSGMIHPNMATMISVITTDANISKKTLEPVFRSIVDKTYNRITVDGDTSVCDMVVMLANGEADDTPIVEGTKGYEVFAEALEYVCRTLAKMLASDGEGATKLIEVRVINAPDKKAAYGIAVSIAKSPLVKTAVFGEDANWGRIITAAGYSGENFNPECIDIYIGNLKMCENGKALNFDEATAKEILKEKEVAITFDMKNGREAETMWTCDFSYDYIKINGSYRS